jgi:membrane protease subunit HflC
MSLPRFFVAVLVVLGATIFTVDQRQYAIVFQLGEVRSVIEEPGLYLKWPLIQNVRYFDKRILTLDSAEPERFITFREEERAGRLIHQVADH